MASLSRYLQPLPETDLLAGVFAFLDASLPESLRLAAIEKDFGIGRVESCDEAFFIAKILNSNFRLQFRKCPLRAFLANFRLYHRDDMADALTQAYSLSKRGSDPEAALCGDYTPGFLGLLKALDIEEFREAEIDSSKHRWWNQFAGFHEEGDRFVEYDHRTSDGYLLFRGDRLVWKMKSTRFTVIDVSLRWKTEMNHFISLGNTKGFLNGDFTWPQEDWVNPVTDAEEKAYAEDNTFKKIMERIRAGRE